ncbi:MAG: hypothetical protein ACI8V2_002582 [Candidatus Latescibacterota bacterium]|jgi:hypothetical protein
MRDENPHFNRVISPFYDNTKQPSRRDQRLYMVGIYRVSDRPKSEIITNKETLPNQWQGFFV